MSEMTVEQSQIEREVFAICDDLSAKDEKISVRIILSYLDGITSTSTVHAPLKKWRDIRKAKKQQVIENLKFSPALAEAVADEISRHTAESDRLAMEEVKAINEQNKELIDDLQLVEKRLSEETLLLQTAHSAYSSLEKKINEQSRSHDTLVKELRAQIADLNHVNSELRSSKEMLRTEIAKIELKGEGNAAELIDTKERLKALSEDNKMLNTENNKLNNEHARLSTQSDYMNKILETLERDNQTLKTELQSLNLHSSKISEELATVKVHDDGSKQVLEQYIKMEQATVKEIARLENENQQLKSQLSSGNKGI